MKEKILSIFILAFLLIIIGMTSVNAASCGISVTGSDVEIGQNVTITVSFTQPATSASFRLNYDSTKVQYISNSAGGRNTGSSVVVDYLSMDLKPIKSATFTFSTKSAGTANFSVSGITLSAANLEEYSISYNNGKTITIKEKAVVKPDPKPEQPEQPEQPTTPTQPEQPTTPTQPEQPKEPTFRSDNSKVYATANVNVRSSWTTENSSNILGLLKKGEEITRTGISSEWDRVTYKGRVAYIRHGYLTTTKPEEEDNNTVNENPVDDNVVGNIVDNTVVGENNTNTENTNANLNEENSVAGENNIIENNIEGKGKTNGKIIAIVISAAAIIVVGIIMFLIYKKVNDEDDDEDEEEVTKKTTKTTTTGNNRTTTRNTVARSTSTRNTTARNTTKKNTQNKSTTGKKQ